MQLFKELYNYREMIYMLVRREIRGRYKGSALGFLWTFINPLMQFAVYAVVFSVLMRTDIEKFYAYLFIGFIPWFFLSTSIPLGSICVQQQANLVQKIYFPRIILPLATTLTTFVNMLLSELVVFAVLVISGIGLSIHILALPVIMVVELMFVLGIVLIVSALNVYFRDLAHIMEIITMAWFYATPIVYPPEMVKDSFPWLLVLNPMSGIIASYRDILYYHRWPQFSSLTLAVVFGVATVILGTVIFQRLQRGFAEEL